jgi:hypothetical protein
MNMNKNINCSIYILKEIVCISICCKCEKEFEICSQKNINVYNESEMNDDFEDDDYSELCSDCQNKENCEE